MAEQPWTGAELFVVVSGLEAGLSLSGIGAALHRPGRDVDLAAWAMVGRTLEEAATALNARRPAPRAGKSRIPTFIRDMFEGVG